MTRYDWPWIFFSVMLLNIRSQLIRSEKIWTFESFVNMILNLQRFFVFSFLEHWLNQSTTFDFVIFLKLLVFVKHCRIPQTQFLADLLQFYCSVGIVSVFLENFVHFLELFYGDGSSNLTLFLFIHALTLTWMVNLLRTL